MTLSRAAAWSENQLISVEDSTKNQMNGRLVLHSRSWQPPGGDLTDPNTRINPEPPDGMAQRSPQVGTFMKKHEWYQRSDHVFEPTVREGAGAPPPNRELTTGRI